MDLLYSPLTLKKLPVANHHNWSRCVVSAQLCRNNIVPLACGNRCNHEDALGMTLLVGGLFLLCVFYISAILDGVHEERRADPALQKELVCIFYPGKTSTRTTVLRPAVVCLCCMFIWGT